MRNFFDLTKFGIVCFVIFTGTAAYFLSLPPVQPLDSTHFLYFILSLYFVSSAIFALNQLQEADIDALMPRTKNRPLPSGQWSKIPVALLCLSFLIIGFVFAFMVSLWTLIFLFATLVMYNGLYTMFWKRRWAFGAVPGAIPGSMSILVGYGANGQQWSMGCFYLFVLMFLWQMPHFWALALRYQKDYEAAKIPVLPTVVGEERTLYHMGLYVFAYAAWAVAAPWFISVWIGYLVVILPFVCKVVYEFFTYQKDPSSRNWLSFFLWTTFSVLVFVIIPVFDKWGELVFYRL